MEHNWFWLVKSRIWKGFRVKGHRSPPPHTIDFIECRDETTVSIVRSWPSNYRMCTRIPFINQSSIHANCLLTAKCVRSRSWLQETGQNRALAICCRLGTGTTFKTQNWSIFLLDQAQKKKKTGKPEANQINCAATRLRCRSIRQMAAHFVFIKGIDEGAKAHVWPDGGINFYFNEKFFCTVVQSPHSVDCVLA